MKLLLILSLIVNVILGVAFFQKEKEPVLEHIVIKDYPEKKPVEVIKVEAPVVEKKKTKKNEKGEWVEFDPVIATDEQSFQQAHEEMEQARRDYLEKIDITDEILKKKEKILKKYWADYAVISKKHPTGMTMSYAEKLEMLNMEEKLDEDLEKLFGSDKWQSYRSFVDGYNKKIDESRRKNGMGIGGLVMGYY